MSGKPKKRTTSKSPKREKSPTRRARSPKREKSPSKKTKSPKRDSSPKKKSDVKKPAKEKWVSPPIKTINEGKYDDYTKMFDNFNLPDLQLYCKNEGLKISGRKPDVIKRILLYRKTGEKEEVAPKKRKRSSSATKKTAKSGSEKESPKKKVAKA